MIMVVPNEVKAKLFPTNAEVSSNMAALMTMLNNPRVKIVIGSDNTNRMGRTTAFNNASTRLARMATHTLDTTKEFCRLPAQEL